MDKKLMMLKLVRPTLEMKQAALKFKQEFFDNGETVINGSEMLDNMDSYEEWLASITDNQSADTVNPDWVVTDTFLHWMEMKELLVSLTCVTHSMIS